jgi:hypothetical protein
MSGSRHLNGHLRWLAGLPAGWHALYGFAATILEAEDPNCEVVQAKEKLGGLRIYVRGGNGRGRQIALLASVTSSRICQECGSPGVHVISGSGTYATLCEFHGKACSAHLVEQEEEHSFEVQAKMAPELPTSIITSFRRMQQKGES